MFHSLRIGPTESPVLLRELKDSARIDGEDEDDLIDGLIASAAKTVEEMCGRSLMPQTWDLKLYGVTGDEKVRLKSAPVSSISAISYQDETDTTQTMDTANFYLFADDDRAYVQPKAGTSWPTTFDRPDALTISYVAGYASRDAVPEELKQAVILLATHWYEHRTLVGHERMVDIPFTVGHLVGLERRGWVGA